MQILNDVSRLLISVFRLLMNPETIFFDFSRLFHHFFSQFFTFLRYLTYCSFFQRYQWKTPSKFTSIMKILLIFGRLINKTDIFLCCLRNICRNGCFIYQIMEKYKENNHNALVHCKSITNFFKNTDTPLTQDPSQNPSFGSLRSERSTDRSMIPPTTFNFEAIERTTSRGECPGRIHAKLSTRRLGGKVVLAGRKQKRQQKKENRPYHTRFKELRESQERQRLSDQQVNPPNFISIKSYQPNERASCTESCLSNSKTIVSQAVSSQGEVYEIFKEVRRRLEGELQYQRKIDKKNKCFYSHLKQKLKQQVRKTEDQKKRDKMTLLVQGCHAVQHLKLTQREYLHALSTQHSRPQIGTPKTCRNTLALAERESRPKSCRSSAAIHSPRYFNCKSEKTMVKPKKERCSAKPRPTTEQYRSLQSSRSPSLHKSKQSPSPDSHIYEASSRLAQIIDDCDGERAFGDLKLNMKTFQFYCKKMDDGFTRAGRKIDQIQCMQID